MLGGQRRTMQGRAAGGGHGKKRHAMMSFKGVQPTRRPSAGRARLALFVVWGGGFLFIKEGNSGDTEHYFAARRGRASCSTRPA